MSPPSTPSTSTAELGGRGSAARTLVELAVITVFVAWFHAPYLWPGMPRNDFGSDLMATLSERRLVPAPLSFPVWNPDAMCGRPEVGFYRPVRLFDLLYFGLDPLSAQKAGVVLFHVLAGLAMYALLRDSGGGHASAFFGGLIYPILPAHIARASIHGHIHVVRFFALAPLLLLAYFRCRRPGAKGAVLLGLVLGAALSVDAQRAILFAIMLGVLLAVETGVVAAASLAGRGGSPAATLHALGRFALAVALAVTINAFELVNGFVGDGEHRGFSRRDLEFFVGRWSNDNLYTFADRGGVIASSLKAVSPSFETSESRYLGVILLGCWAAALVLAPGVWRSRLGTATGLALLSVWLAAGERPIGPAVATRLRDVLGSAKVATSAKLAIFIVAVGIAALGANALSHLCFRTGRSRPRALGLGLGLGLFLALTWVFLYSAPYPLLKWLVPVLRNQRNPDWFQVAAVSTCATYCGALGASTIRARLAGSRVGPLVVPALLALALLDYAPYRAGLANQRSGEAVARFRETAAFIAADPDEFRVLPLTSYDNGADSLQIWHGRPLAWDYRLATAPMRTRKLMNFFFRSSGTYHDDPAVLAGLANVKYVVDTERKRQPPEGLVEVMRTDRTRVYEVSAWRPYLQAFSEVHLAVVSHSTSALTLTAALARHGIALISTEEAPEPGLAIRVKRVHADPEAIAARLAPATSEPLGDHPIRIDSPRAVSPLLDHERKGPGSIRVEAYSEVPFFLVVAESFHPLWRARLDGKPVSLYPASYAFMGTFMPAGAHVLELEIRRGFAYYLWIPVGFLALAGSAGYLLWPALLRLRRARTR